MSSAARLSRRITQLAVGRHLPHRTVRVRLTPLEDRLTRLLATIPVELQREGLSLASLQASLRGRSRGNCHPGELGTALRRVGFRRERRWKDDADFTCGNGKESSRCLSIAEPIA